MKGCTQTLKHSLYWMLRDHAYVGFKLDRSGWQLYGIACPPYWNIIEKATNFAPNAGSGCRCGVVTFFLLVLQSGSVYIRLRMLRCRWEVVTLLLLVLRFVSIWQTANVHVRWERICLHSGWRSKAFAISQLLTTSVLMPLPLPWICRCVTRFWENGYTRLSFNLYLAITVNNSSVRILWSPWSPCNLYSVIDSFAAFECRQIILVAVHTGQLVAVLTRQYLLQTSIRWFGRTPATTQASVQFCNGGLRMPVLNVLRD